MKYDFLVAVTDPLSSEIYKRSFSKKGYNLGEHIKLNI